MICLKRTLNYIGSSVLLAGLAVISQGCMDDTFSAYGPIPEGYGLVNLEMSFTPDADVTLETRAGTPGNAIKNIDDLFIVVFDASGDSVCSRYFPNGSFKVSEEARTDGNPVKTSELSTQKAVVQNVRLPYGRHHIYAVANMGNLAKDTNHSESVATESSFRAIRFGWDSNNISNNCQMSGYFTTDNSYPTYGSKGYYLNSAADVTLTPEQTTLHAWLRRAVSKVTIDYDASNINENVFIYLKNVTIHDIPYSCSLMENNSPRGNGGKVVVGGVEVDDLIKNGESIVYSTAPDENEPDTTIVLSKGHPFIKNHAAIHDNDAPSLFFFENMQNGTHEAMPDKRQDANGDGFLDDPGSKHEGLSGWKDDVPGGTYIEVEAFYVSTSPKNYGKGQIKYRFMLGKDVIQDYDAERNHHYKLTLKFNGNANDVDWHIDYDEDDVPGIYTPVYYVSYRYNEPDKDLITDDAYWDKCYPIRLAGDNVGEKITVRITENNWNPDQAESTEYYQGEVYTYNGGTANADKPGLSARLLRSGVWHGFLSLYKQEGKASLGVEQNKIWGRRSAGEYRYWYERGQKPYYENLEYESRPAAVPQSQEHNYGEGYREYSTTPGFHYDADFGDYKVEVTYKNGIKETIVYIPLFTRPLIINQKKGFTGNNPYFSYQRYAKLQINATINGKEYEVPADVYQVRRIINPKGVFRSWDNIKPFKVDLSYRISESAGTDFTTFTSNGPWRASIVSGSGWHIVGKSSGSSGSYISVTVAPDGKLADETKTATALLLIEYHDYKCVHYVHLRQGYAPIQLIDNGPYWHTFNLSYVKTNENSHEAVMSHAPLDGGSMYRYGNFEDPIDPINNTREKRDIIGTSEEKYATYNSLTRTSDGFFIGPVGENKNMTSFKKWGQIPSYTSWEYDEMTYNGVTVRLPKFDDFEDMRSTKNEDMEYSFGLCYGDGATEIEIDDETVFYYSRYNHHGVPKWISRDYPEAAPHQGTDPNGENAVRGCFVYNKSKSGSLSGNVVFFPLGSSSYGRRKANSNDNPKYYTRGALHYADFDDVWENVISGQEYYVPAMNRLYSNYGACYWLSDNKSLTDGICVAWDFNYTTIDYNPIYQVNLHTAINYDSGNNTSGSDACLVRLVQDDRPTPDECKEMTKRVDDFINGTNVWPTD